MGADFLQRVGKTLKRSWDQGRVAMAETDLTGAASQPISFGERPSRKANI